MQTIADVMMKMISGSKGNLHDIEHFLKVYSYAKTIGEKELTEEADQMVLETAAILHDIACPLCREKYSSTAGHLQELESAPLVEKFLGSFSFSKDFIDKVVWLVCHHHTYTDVTLPEHRILLEADFLVNASESNYGREQIESAKHNFFRTETGIKLLNTIYLIPESST